MKQFTLLALCAALYAFSSCSKERDSEPDARNQYVGTWEGEVTVALQNFSDYKTSKTRDIVIKQEHTKNKIAFLHPTLPSDWEATVNGNAFTFDEFTINQTINGQTIDMTMSGKGTIKGKKMTASGPLSYKLNGSYGNGTWTATWTKKK